jgi:hypothetical protein
MLSEKFCRALDGFKLCHLLQGRAFYHERVRETEPDNTIIVYTIYSIYHIYFTTRSIVSTTTAVVLLYTIYSQSVYGTV